MHDSTRWEKAQDQEHEDPKQSSNMRSRGIIITILKQTERMPRRHDGASNPPGAQALSHLVNIHIYDLYL